MVGSTWKKFSLTQWLIGTKYSMKITLFDTNTAILLAIAIKIDTQFLTYYQKNNNSNNNRKNN